MIVDPLLVSMVILENSGFLSICMFVILFILMCCVLLEIRNLDLWEIVMELLSMVINWGLIMSPPLIASDWNWCIILF